MKKYLLIILFVVASPLLAEEVGAQKGVADGLFDEMDQIGQIATRTGPKPLCEERNGRNNRHSQRQSPQLFEHLSNQKPVVLVTLSPFKTFVEKVAGGRVDVEVLIPPASDPHTYTPTPRQVERVGKAQIWFRMGEVAERPVAQAIGNRIEMVDLLQGLDLITDPAARCPCCAGADLHIWTSVRNAEMISQTIANTLITRYPEWKAEIEANLSNWMEELQETDREIESILRDRCSNAMLVSHPAFGYFARDYGLRQLSIEVEGKEPTPGQLAAIVQSARDADVQVVIVQPQRSRRGADRIAKELGLPVVVVDPFAKAYTANLIYLAKVLACPQS